MTYPDDALYQQWLGELKQTIQTAQQRTVPVVNQQLLKLYWQIGGSYYSSNKPRAGVQK